MKTVVDVEVIIKATVEAVMIDEDTTATMADVEELITKYGAKILSSPVVLFVTKAEK